MKKYFLSGIFLMSLLFLHSCASVMQMANIINCEFRMKSVNQTKLAGISIEDKSNIRSLGFSEIGRLTSAYLNKDLPLSFQLNIEAKNPNSNPASLSKFDWILTIDDIEMTRGTNSNQVSIPGNNGVTTIPMQISVNLFDALKNESKDALLNFAFNLADASDKPTRIGLKLKPTIYLGQVPITYPDYINVGTEFGGN